MSQAALSIVPLRVFVPKDSGAVSVGADQVAAHVLEVARKMDLPIELVRTGSRGAYWLEPLLEIQTLLGDGEVGVRKGYACAGDAEDVAQIFEQFLTNDTMLRDGNHWFGPLQDLPFLRNQSRQVFARCGVNDPLDIDAYALNGGFDALKIALGQSAQETIAQMELSGLRGRGGAGFPAHIKWSTVAQQSSNEKYVCCNADEGDSGTFADRMLMEGDPFTLLEGMIIAGISVGAREGLIYVRSEYPAAIDALRAATQILRERNWLGQNIGGSGATFDIEIRRGAGSYVCGEESAMLESLEGKRGQVRAKPPIPALKGFLGQPTLVHNVLTLASVPQIIAFGGKAYATHGVGRSTGTQAFQLSGMVRQPGLVEVDFGLTLGELIHDFGGGMRDGAQFKAAQLGGPLGAYLGPAALDVPLTYEHIAAAGGMLGHGGVVVFDQHTDMVQMARFAMAFCALESCGKCTPCRVGAVRGTEVIDKIMAGDEPQKNAQLLDDLCDLMENGSLCAMGGLTPLPVRSALDLADKGWRDNAIVAHMRAAEIGAE